MSKKYFDTKTGSLEEKITKIATEQPSITKPESNVKLTVEKSYFGVKPGSISDVAAKIVSEGLDPVNKDAVKKKFDDRKDKDIDNDGDVDSTDKYLHKRRKAISKEINEGEGDQPCPHCKAMINAAHCVKENKPCPECGGKINASHCEEVELDEVGGAAFGGTIDKIQKVVDDKQAMKIDG